MSIEKGFNRADDCYARILARVGGIPVRARATSGDPDVRVQLERLIPLKEGRIPFIWVIGEEFDQFEQHLRDSEIVKDTEVLTRVGESTLYYTEWYTDGEAFLNGLSDTNASIMEAHGDSTWSFTVRFRDHADPTRFHQFYQAHDYPVHVDRVYAPTKPHRPSTALASPPHSVKPWRWPSRTVTSPFLERRNSTRSPRK